MADVFFNAFVDALSVDTVGGSEKIPVVDGGVSKYQTPDLLKTYILAALTASSAITPTTGDALLVERAGSEGTFDLDALCDYVYAYLWSDPSAITPAATGDTLILDRAGTKYTVAIDTLVTYINSTNGSLGSQITALAAATLADSDEYVLSQGGTAAKVTFTNLSARVHDQFNAHLAALTAVVTPADANELYVLQGSTAKKMSLTVLANTYLAAEIGIEDLTWAPTEADPALAGDMLLMNRGGTTYKLDVDTLTTYAATGLQAGVLDFSGLASATPNATDEFVVDDAGTPKSFTLTALESTLWTDYATYVAALAQNTLVTDTDVFYCIQGGTAKYVTPVELETYFNISAGDVFGPIATTPNYVPQWDSATNTLIDGLAVVTTVNFDGTESDSSLATEKAVSEAIESFPTLGHYDHIHVSSANMVDCTTNGAAAIATNEYGTNDIDLRYFAFDGGATAERVQFTMAMPPGWDRGTIKAKFYWSSATGSTAGDTVEWAIKAGALSDNDTIDAALGTAQVVSDILLANNGTKMQLTDATPAITVGGAAALGDLLVFEVYRNTSGTDVMTEDAWLFGVTLQYQKTNIVAAW